MLTERKCSATSAPYSGREAGRRMKMSIGFLAPGATNISTPKEQHKARDGSGQPSTQTCDTVDHSSFALPPPALTNGRDTCHPPEAHVSPSAGSDPGKATHTEDEDGGQPAKPPRAPRPAYSEEQKFYIMFARIIRGRSWPEIERDFARLFGPGVSQRSKGGLTSVYYRVRKDWGLEDVLQTDTTFTTHDRQVVDLRARRFSWDFLVSIGYLD
ncbi:hypothetical protein KC360_g8907 [Hortaea werneckii]|nr:hypothetical protein KC361_g1719 [Hortaea werneckii]KAI6877978.1 hypothetical protein KC325_g8908 [Hortaea werneckii]KAI6985704.1 hypothetical protein KC359_g9052 [Hortaea werneckii]KAI7140155.1 hypothetical protein KC344_g8911 [Hortaea werneckii]KAI7166996.1 hypothetical protein KC360_g8907 [Hortaea werneckii]